MNKEIKKTIEPKLRFTEFKNNGNWVEKTLGEIAEIITGNTPSTNDSDNFGGDKMFVSPADISDERYIIKTKTTLSKKGFSLTRHVKENSILFVCIGSTIGKIAQNKFECATNQQINSIVPYEGYSSDFIYSTLQNDSSKIASIAGIHAIPIINKSSFSSVVISLPKPDEQQKIADCLSSLDELISAENQKLEVYKGHKKGLMQHMFPGEGEKVPKLRFEEFEREWEESTFGDAAKFINGRAYKQEELLEYGKYRVLRVGNFFTNNNWYYSDLELEADKYCEEGDLLYAWSASFGPKIWKGEKTIYHYHIWKVVSNDGIDKNYLFKLLDYHTEKMKSQNANGFALLHITKGNIESWKCYFPKSEKEQQKIASFLSSLDELIIGQTEKIGLLKEHKKGLMQGMFPNV